MKKWILLFLATSGGAIGFDRDPAFSWQNPGPHYKSPLGLAVDDKGQRAYVALNTAHSLAVVDLEAGKVLQEIPVGKAPHDIALGKGMVFVTCEHEDTLTIVELPRLEMRGKIATGRSPRGLALLPDGKVFVACHDDKTLHGIDPATKKSQVLPLPGWPERLLLHRDAQYPYVLALTSNPGEAMVHMIAAEPKLKIMTTSKLPGVSNPRGLASKQGTSSFVLVVHQNPRDQVPATQIAQGWVFTNSISSFSPWGIDTPRGSAFRAKVLDQPQNAFADPSDVVFAADKGTAFVASAGGDKVLALRTDKFVSANYGPLFKEDEHFSGRDDLSLSRHYVIARLPTQANPRRLALSGDGKTLVVSNYLADSLTVIDTDKMQVVRTIPLAAPSPPGGEGGVRGNAARRGEILFNSARMTFMGQFTCASCHPNGHTDGLNWDQPRDGIGNFLNTRSLLGVKDTAPYGWHGSSQTLADRIAGTLRTLHRHEPQGTQVDDIRAYLETLSAPRPLTLPGVEKDAVERGQAIFSGKGKCASCHHGKAYDDEISHDVGTRVEGDNQDRFDTPSLRGLSRTAPYLHHGQAQTLEEIFTKYNPRQRHGTAHTLTPGELADVLAFLKSL